MNKFKKKFVVIFFILIFLLSFTFIFNRNIFATLGPCTNTNSTSPCSSNGLEMGTDECPAPYYIPPACSGRGQNYTADLNCAANKFSNPNDKCCPNLCADQNNQIQNNAAKLDPSTFPKFVIFGTTFRLAPEAVPGLVKLIFQTFLGIVSLYALIRGVYLAGFKRTTATTPDDIAKVTKEITNILIGFAISWGFILIIQVVANFLGLGDLNAINLTDNTGANVVVIK